MKREGKGQISVPLIIKYSLFTQFGDHLTLINGQKTREVAKCERPNNGVKAE